MEIQMKMYIEVNMRKVGKNTGEVMSLSLIWEFPLFFRKIQGNAEVHKIKEKKNRE